MLKVHILIQNKILHRLTLKIDFIGLLFASLSFKKPTRNSLLFGFLKFPHHFPNRQTYFTLFAQFCYILKYVHRYSLCWHCIHVWWQFRSSQIWIFYSSCFQMIENSKICVILPEVQNEPDVQRKVMRKGVHIKSILMQACVIFYSELEREFNIQYLSGYIFLYPK